MQNFIAQLEEELEKSLRQKAAATAARERAAAEEAKWEQDIRSLKNLISRRRNDLANQGIILNSVQAAADESYSTADDPHYVSGFEEINRIAWSLKEIAKAGRAGLLPTEIYEAAKQQGRSMHPNYPYTATSKLLERGLVAKVGKRYVAIEKEVAPVESTS